MLLVHAHARAETGAANECEKCHELELQAYARSAHRIARTLCHDCHGGNPAALRKEDAHRAEDGFVARCDDPIAFCGRCHEGVAEHYQRGPHYDRFDARVFDVMTCTTCHHYHDVEEVSEVWLKVNCESCHRVEPGRLAAGLRFFELVRLGRAKISALESSEAWLRSRGFACVTERDQAQTVRGLVEAIGPLSHALKEEECRKAEGELAELAGKTLDLLEEKERAYQGALVALLPAWLLAAWAAVALLRTARQYSLSTPKNGCSYAENTDES
ncbi:MAG: hypothetical protein HYU36_10835 [Planctomycetes bacterium]|nr:hypothetical protein [Planctomycetota bacterium]